MEVWRCEGPSGIGPFRDGNLWLFVPWPTYTQIVKEFEDRGVGDDEPQIEAQKIGKYGEFEKIFAGPCPAFGTLSIPALLKWFGPTFRSVLRKRDYNFVKYDVPESDLCELHEQVIFSKSGAKPILKEAIP